MSALRASLAARNAVASLILAALDDADGTALLAGAVDALGTLTARLPRALADRLQASGLVEALNAADPSEVRLRPELEGERASVLARLRRGLDAVVRFQRMRDDARHTGPARDHAARPADAVAAADAAAPDDAVRSWTALAQAIALWEAALFFEVHEVLELRWREVEGEERRFLQGVIQIAAALHHVECGNRGGAQTLLAAGRAKLETFAPDFAPVDVAELLRGVDRWITALAGDAPLPDALRPPALIVAP